MSSDNDGNSKGSGSDAGPRTSWVRMPAKDARPPAAPEPRGSAPPPVGPAAAPPPRTRPSGEGSPFGGFSTGSTTGMMRRSGEGSRTWMVAAVVVTVLALSGAAIWLAVRPTHDPVVPVATDGPVVVPDPKPTEVDEGDAEAEALGYTKAGQKPVGTSSGQTSGTKSSGTTSSGTKTGGSKTGGSKTGAKPTKVVGSGSRNGSARSSGH